VRAADRGCGSPRPCGTCGSYRSPGSGQPAVALCLALEPHAIGPLAQQGLDEPFCLAVGARLVGPGAFRCQIQGLTGLPPRLCAVRTAVIREHPAARDPLDAKPGHGSDQKADRRGLFLIRQDLGIVKPCRIVDGDVDFPKPAPLERPRCRSPVIRWPTRSNRASCLMSTWIMSPGWAHWYRRTGTGGCKCLRPPRPMALRVRLTLESGAASRLAMRLRVQR